MKKITMILFAVAIAGSVASCKKCANCQWKDSNGDVTLEEDLCDKKTTVNAWKSANEFSGATCVDE